MFGLFKKQTPLDKLYNEYEKLLKESKDLSSSNRKLSDQKFAEANNVLVRIEELKSQ